MQSVSLLAQSFCRLITHTAEQHSNQNTIWFELLSQAFLFQTCACQLNSLWLSLLTCSLRLLRSFEVQLTDRIFFFPEALGDSLFFFLLLLIARYIADGLYYAYTTDHQLTVHYLQQSQHLTCIKASPLSAGVYDIIIYDATPTTQYTLTAGSCIIITPY